MRSVTDRCSLRSSRRWGSSSEPPSELGVVRAPPPKHPYRDTLLIYGVLATVIVLVAWLTGWSAWAGRR